MTHDTARRPRMTAAPAIPITDPTSRPQRSGRWRTALPALLPLGLAACAAYGGKALQTVPADIHAPHGIEISAPDAISEPIGLRFHGWICRRATAASAPRALRLERIDAAGQVSDAAHAGVRLNSGRRDCATYDIPTDWRLAPAETVRICASSDSQACPVTAP
jgi:hypothetical protein